MSKIAELRELAASTRTRLTTDPRFTAEGRRLELTRAISYTLNAVLTEYRDAAATAKAARGKVADAERKALGSLPAVSDLMIVELGRLARESKDFRGRLELAIDGGIEAAATPDMRYALLAFAQAPAAELYGMPPGMQQRARAALNELMADRPDVQKARAESADALATVQRYRDALRELEPELDTDYLRQLKVVAMGPSGLSEAENAAWMADDPAGWAMAAADEAGGRLFWVDPRADAPLPAAA